MRITAEQPGHAAAIEALLDESFGPARFSKTVYRLRHGVEPVHALSLVALWGEVLEGTIRYWPVSIAGTVPALLLGPVAVSAHRRSGGLGGVLIRHSLESAAALGHRIVLLVGDAPYYTRFGFRRDLAEPLALPGPVDLERFLALELVTGALDGVSGMVEPARPEPTRTARCCGALD
ncbi:putative acetyltransferase [Azospirillaceae bacterium]